MAWTYAHCCVPIQGSERLSPQLRVDPFPLDLGCVIGSDGGGGEESSDPRLRRCGWGFVVLRGAQYLAWGLGPLPCDLQTVPAAELFAITRAVQLTTGPVVCVIDNDGVVRGIRAGPRFKHRKMIAMWREFWTAVGARPIVVHKIRSHLSLEDAQTLGYDSVHWQANRLADKAAEEGARIAQVPFESRRQVLEADNLCGRVLDSLLAVSTSLVKQAPTLYGAAAKGNRQEEAKISRARSRQVRDEALAELVAASGHSVEQRSRAPWRCTVCCQSDGGDRELFLRSSCPGRPATIHHSHRLEAFRGFFWCQVCGGTGVPFKGKLLKLGRTCVPGLTDHGKRVIKCLEAGKLPPDLKAWPA